MIRSGLVLLFAASTVLPVVAQAKSPAPVPLIERAKFFGNPTRTAGRISPDGKWLSWIAPRDGVLNVWVAPLSDLSKARPMTAETKRQDAQLNKAYKALMADLSPARKTQLQEAQRAWIKYRDANCGFYYDPDGGTLARVSANDCVMTSTAERAREPSSRTAPLSKPPSPYWT